MNEHIISILRPPYRLVKKICKPIFKIIYHGDKYECNICHSNLKLMKDGGINDVFFEQHRVIGGGGKKARNVPRLQFWGQREVCLLLLETQY